jgi:hypothetical protein
MKSSERFDSVASSRPSRFTARITCVALLIIWLAVAAVAQESRGTIIGRVSDASGAVLPGINVAIISTATNVTITATTNDEGRFSAPFLLPGVYRVTVEKTGFKRLVQNVVEVRVSETVELNLSLQAGEVTEAIEVAASTPLLDTAGSSLGQVIDERRVQELPLFAGNPMELTLIATGVVNSTDMRLRKAGFNNAPSQFSSDGNGQYNNDFTIDGIPNNFPVGNGTSRVAFSPPVYSVKEFKIQTSSYDATVGHTIGALTNVNTATGANSLHGEVHLWERNSFLDAANFFNNKNNTKRTSYGDHRFGASAGGPVWLPKVYNGRDKTFWYFAWESNRWSDSGSFTATVPTAKQREGDFSDLLKISSNYQLYNPFTTRPDTAGRFRRDPFVNNIIPKALLNPVALKLLEFYPLPNQTGTVDGRNNFFQPYKILESYDVYMARVDHAFSDRHRMFARAHYDTWTEQKWLTGNTFFNPDVNQIQLDRKNSGLALDDVYSFSSTFVTNIRYGITYQSFPEKRVSQGTDLAALGFSANLISQLLDKSLATVPRIQLGGYASLSGWESGDGTNTGLIHSFANTNTWLVGRHNLRFGADIRFYRSFGNRFPTDIAPDFNFATSASFLRGPLDNAAAAPIGQDLGAFLLGIPAGSMSRTASFAAQDKFFGFFIQNDFKVSPKLTLNLGLRYELETPITERYNRLVAGFAFDESNPLEAAARANYALNPIPELPVSQFRVRGGLQFVNQNGNGRSPFNGEKNNFLPRFGFAWQPLDKMVVRGGYGIFYDTLGVNTIAPIQTGFSQSTPIQASLDNGVTYVATFANPFPNGLITPPGTSAGLLTNINQGVSFFDPNLKHAYAQRWSLGIQYELPAGFVVDSAYVANRGTRLAVSRNYNATPNRFLSTLATRDLTTINFLSQQFPNPFRGLNPIFGNNISREQLLRPYPAFGAVTVEEPIGYSWYHSLQSKIEKRFASGFTFQLAYTWSKQMDAVEFLNAGDPLPYETISGGDRTHRVAASGIAELPFGKGRRYASDWPRWADTVVGGWQIAWVIQRQSGPPIGFGNVIFNGNIDNITLPKDDRDVDRWFNTDAGFNRNAAQQLASNLRTFPLRFSGLRGDDQQRWDFSLSKKFILTERVYATLKGEAFNAFNHVNFNTPNTNPTDTNFGRITGTQSAARSWQFALKVTF